MTEPREIRNPRDVLEEARRFERGAWGQFREELDAARAEAWSPERMSRVRCSLAWWEFWHERAHDARVSVEYQQSNGSAPLYSHVWGASMGGGAYKTLCSPTDRTTILRFIRDLSGNVSR